MDGWTDGWVDGWMDGKARGLIDLNIVFLTRLRCVYFPFYKLRICVYVGRGGGAFAITYAFY